MSLSPLSGDRWEENVDSQHIMWDSRSKPCNPGWLAILSSGWGWGHIPWHSSNLLQGKRLLKHTEYRGQIIPKPLSGWVMQCSNDVLASTSARGKRCFYFFFTLSVNCVWVAGVASKLSTVWNMFSIVFFLWRKLQCEKERGREEHYIPNSLQEIIAKALLLSSGSPSLPGFSDFSLSSRIWQITAAETSGAGGPGASARASPRCASCFSSSGDSRVPTCGCPQRDLQKVLFREKWAIFFPWWFGLFLKYFNCRLGHVLVQVGSRTYWVTTSLCQAFSSTQ